jgi:hypothetical protein
MLSWIFGTIAFLSWTGAFVWYFFPDIKRWWESRRTRARAGRS